MSTRVVGRLSFDPDDVFLDDATVPVHVPETAVVKDAEGNVIGSVLRAWAEDGIVYAEMELSSGRSLL